MIFSLHYAIFKLYAKFFDEIISFYFLPPVSLFVQEFRSNLEQPTSFFLSLSFPFTLTHSRCVPLFLIFLSFSHSIYLFLFFPLYVSCYLNPSPSLSLSFFFSLSFSLSFCLSISISLSLSFSIYLCIFLYLSIYLFKSLSIHDS